jgi:hypothetical protein
MLCYVSFVRQLLWPNFFSLLRQNHWDRTFLNIFAVPARQKNLGKSWQHWIWSEWHVCGAKWLYSVHRVLVIYSLRVLKSEIRKWTVNFSSNVGIENCGLFLVLSCGSVLFYISFGSVRNRSVSAQSTVLTFGRLFGRINQKGLIKRGAVGQFCGRIFAAKGPNFTKIVSLRLSFLILGKCPRNIVIFPLTQTKIVSYAPKNSFKKGKSLWGPNFFSQQLNFSSWLSRKFSKRVGSTVSPTSEDSENLDQIVMFAATARIRDCSLS